MSALELLTTTGDTLADHARVTAAWSVLASVAKDEADARRNGAIADRVRAAAEATGANGFTGRFDGVKVILTDPEPKPRVSDPDEFAAWVHDIGAQGIVEWRDRVVMDRPDVIIETLDAITRDEITHEDACYALSQCLLVVAKPYVADDAIERLEADGRIKITAHGAHDTESGEMVPGVTVSTAAQQVRVVPEKGAKAEFAGQLRAALGVGGDA